MWAVFLKNLFPSLVCPSQTKSKISNFFLWIAIAFFKVHFSTQNFYVLIYTWLMLLQRFNSGQVFENSCRRMCHHFPFEFVTVSKSRKGGKFWKYGQDISLVAIEGCLLGLKEWNCSGRWFGKFLWNSGFYGFWKSFLHFCREVLRFEIIFPLFFCSQFFCISFKLYPFFALRFFHFNCFLRFFLYTYYYNYVFSFFFFLL